MKYKSKLIGLFLFFCALLIVMFFPIFYTFHTNNGNWLFLYIPEFLMIAFVIKND